MLTAKLVGPMGLRCSQCILLCRSVSIQVQCAKRTGGPFCCEIPERGGCVLLCGRSRTTCRKRPEKLLGGKASFSQQAVLANQNTKVVEIASFSVLAVGNVEVL